MWDARAGPQGWELSWAENPAGGYFSLWDSIARYSLEPVEYSVDPVGFWMVEALVGHLACGELERA